LQSPSTTRRVVLSMLCGAVLGEIPLQHAKWSWLHYPQASSGAAQQLRPHLDLNSCFPHPVPPSLDDDRRAIPEFHAATTAGWFTTSEFGGEEAIHLAFNLSCGLSAASLSLLELPHTHCCRMVSFSSEMLAVREVRQLKGKMVTASSLIPQVPYIDLISPKEGSVRAPQNF